MGRMHGSSDASWAGQAYGAAMAALRWVMSTGITTDDGMAWREYTAPGSPICDDLYAGTAGVLAALAEARLGGITEFDDCARAAVRRLRNVASGSAGAEPPATATEPAQSPAIPNTGLYTGLSGMAAALQMWALASGDSDARDGARAIVTKISGIAASTRPVSQWRDLVEGEAGILLVLAELGDAGDKRVASEIADQILSQASWIDGLPDWYPRADHPAFLPNFSHGLAGIGYALGAASTALRRPDLLEVALLAGQRLVRLGSRPDGTIAVPHSIPFADPDAAVSFGWCHGPTGTLRLFQLLDGLQPGHGWSGYAEACRRAVRSSGLPARLYPGFWDNLGQCCGTAGVGEMALDRYQQDGDAKWLDWAVILAQDVLSRRIADESGVRWSHTEHRNDPPDLEPDVGWGQGAAGIASWLLRLARVGEQGPDAAKLWWPDNPVSA